MVHLLPHWNWDNPELGNRVMDEEGRIPVRTFSNAPQCGIDCQWGITRSQELYQNKLADGRTYQEGCKCQ